MIINPGAHISTVQQGWTNTYAEARKEAELWLSSMHSDYGFMDVELLTTDTEKEENEGRWTFTFKHNVTGVEITFMTPGIDNYQEFLKQNIFGARVYWNGSSSAYPELEDFAAPGFKMVKTFSKLEDDMDG